MRRLSAVAAALGAARGAPDGDLITHLPGYGTPKVPQYAGFLNATDEQQGMMHYHYWFATSESPTAATDPVVVWFQGGPGANGLAYGLLTENGPYYMDDSSLANTTEPGVPDVYENPHSWTKVANVLWLQHPPSVGYSYCGDDPKAAKCKWNDDTQAVIAYNGITEFFRAFPQYSGNDLFITGESYGGMYVPTIVEQVHQRGGLNLKGFAIGNGIVGPLDTPPAQRTAAETKFFHGKAFFPESLWGQIMEACGADFSKFSVKCEELQAQAALHTGKFYVYNVYDTCDHVDGAQVSSRPWLQTAADHHAEVAATGRLTQPDSYPCGMAKLSVIYLNLPVVREALHVPPESFYGYPVDVEAGVHLRYSSNRLRLLDIYPEIVGAYRALIYNGDFDVSVPYTGMEHWTASLGFGVTEPWRPWTTDDGSVAGYVTVYDKNNFTTTTVKGAGHMVPTYKGRQALHMITRFLQGQRL